MAIKDGFVVKNGNRSGFPAVPPASAIPYDVNTNVKDKINTKADASSVKNEFLGTLEEWNALSTAQKKEYDTYQITNDYTGGSGLPNYSTTEVNTGQKWIDGKDIYCKVINFGTLPNSTSKRVGSGVTNESIVRCWGTAKYENDVAPMPSASTNAQYTITLKYDESTHEVIVYTNTDMTVYNAYVVLEYTKTA